MKRLYRALYRKIIGRLNPVKYAQKIGVNMPGGGGAYLWGGKLVD